MPITKTCKCGTETVTKDNGLAALKEINDGCPDCGQDVTVKVTTAGREREGRGK